MNGEIRTSVVPGSDRIRVPAGASRPISYGDRIFVRVVNMQQCWRTVVEFELDNVADMSEVYGELRYRTRGERGLTRLYVRNATRGWSFEQPFKLYDRPMPQKTVAATVRRVSKPAASASHPLAHPAKQPGLWPDERAGRRQLPESITLRFGQH